MNEHTARNIVLVRAIETADTAHAILSDDDRRYASRSARELAQWQAADRKSALTMALFLEQRAEQILRRLAERMPPFAAFLKQRASAWSALLAVLPLLALLAGAAIDHVYDPHRVDLLSAPLLLIVLWNLLVYAWLLLRLCLPARAAVQGATPATGFAGIVRALAQRGSGKLPRKLPAAMSSALLAFATEWSQLGFPLHAARLARAIHASAALFAVGAVLSLYARGLLRQYGVGWESTFLDAAQVHQLLSLLFAPAVALFNLTPFSPADIAALRFSGAAPSAHGGALWVHLYGATLLLFVIAPRSVLALIAHWRARRLGAHFPLDLDAPYFRQFGASIGAPAGVLRVLPYSYTLDEAHDKGLTRVAHAMLGEAARVMLRPVIAYGVEPRDALRDIALDDTDVTMTAVLFNVAATPERENHGALLAYLADAAPRGLTVLLDQSAYLQRLGAERLPERERLWQDFCRFYNVPTHTINLLAPAGSQNATFAP